MPPPPDHLFPFDPASEPPLLGRGQERARLTQTLDGPGPRVALITGPRGRGKSALLRHSLPPGTSLHFQSGPLPGPALLSDLQALARWKLGDAPEPKRPGVLPLSSGSSRWQAFLMGLLEVVEDRGTGFTLALDGVEPLLKAERRLWSHLEELVESAGSRGLPFRLVLTSRDPGVLTEMERREGPLARPDLVLPLPRLPYRVAGWAHGSRTPSEAFLHWALLGDEPGHLPPRRNKHVSASGPVSEGRAGTKTSGGPTASWAGVKSAVARRILDPGGDLFDAPLNHLEITFQRPARYATILRALAPAPRDWSGVLERAQGVEGGGQLAPYLRRLEEEGLVERQLPLDADPESRKRRYSVADPFHAFWFRFVLPLRSVLPTSDVEELWDRAIAPGLDAYLQRWLEEAARRWLREHAAETFGVPARTVGALWGGEAPFPLAGRLANGQVCYGLVDWTGTEDDLPGEMKRRMKATRYGIGRAARAPLFFLRRATPDEEVGGEQEELRRTLARDPLARLVGLEELMGPGPPSEAGP